MGIHVSPRPKPPSLFPLYPLPLGCSSELALSALFHASNLAWPSISHMVIYMFQYYSLKSSHPHLLPHMHLYVEVSKSKTHNYFKRAGFHQGKIKYMMLQECRLSIVYMFSMLMSHKTRQT